MAYWLWPLAWALGLAWQLQQASLVPAWHGLAWLVTAAAMVVAARRCATPPVQVLVVAMALALVAYASTGWRALARQSQAPPPSWQGRYATIEAEVVQSPRVADGWVGVTVRVQRVDMEPQPAQSWQGLARLSWYGAKQLPQPGEVWRWPVRWRALHGLANPGGHDSELSAWRAGVWARLSVRSARTVAPPVRLRTAQGQWLTRARAWVWQRLQSSVADERTRGLLAALAVGMQSAITAQDWEIFRRTGVAHLVSISGLHITMFAWLAQAFCALVWRQVGRFGIVALRWPAPAVARWGGLLLAVAYAVEQRKPLVLKSTDPSHRELLSWQVADGSSAAPTYFPTRSLTLDGTQQWLVDGGVIANNPALCAIAEVRRAWPGYGLEDVRVLSVGTGYRTRKINGPASRKWGALGWVTQGHLVDLLADERVVAYQARNLLPSGTYIRVNAELAQQPGLSEAPDDAMDDISEGNIRRLKALGDFWFDAYVDAVLALLLDCYKGPSLDRIDVTTGRPREVLA
ncbi:MAG: ComEC/Rec2 family competence protein [Burkholderiaceae bacterium]